MPIRSVLIIITAALASLLEILDTSIVNVAIPTMMGNLGSTLDEISWVSTAYMIANSIILPIAAWFGTRLGRKNYFTGAILLFTLASLCCGLAPNLPVLIFFRVIQGLAGGALLPTSQTLVQEQFPKEKATQAMAIFGMTVMIGPALGPVIGGYLTDHIGWRSIFNVNVPIGLIAAFLSYLYVDNLNEGEASATKSQASKAVDWAGFALLSLGVGSFQYVLERGQADGWLESIPIRISSLVALIGIVAFIVWELRVKNPIMNLRLFKSNAMRSGAALMLALGVVIYALTFVVPIFSDNIIHLTATNTGLLFIPGSIATAITMMMVGPLMKYVHPRVLITSGVAMGVIGVLMMTHFTTATGGDGLFVPLIFRGIAIGLLFPPIMGAVMSQFQGPEIPQVSGMMNFFRQVGGSVGIASLSTLLDRFGKQNYVDLMPKMSLLSKGGFAQLGGTTIKLSQASLPMNVGLGSPQSMMMKATVGRVMQQTFIMSFNQLCFVISLVIFAMLIPVFTMKMKKGASSNVGAH